MRTLDEATALDQDGARYLGEVSGDWSLLVPNGGYLAAIALRAAGLESGLPIPASISCSFLRMAAAGTAVDVTTTTIARTRRTAAIRVELAQAGERIAEAVVWSVGPGRGPEHDAHPAPEAPEPESLPSWDEQLPASFLAFPLFQQLDARLPRFTDLDAHLQGGSPELLTWFRFKGSPTSDDAYLDAGRVLVLIDTFSFMAARYAHREAPEYIGATLHLHVDLHDVVQSEWLLVRAAAPVAKHGTIGGQADVWSRDGKPLASGGSRMVWISLPPGAVTPTELQRDR